MTTAGLTTTALTRAATTASLRTATRLAAPADHDDGSPGDDEDPAATMRTQAAARIRAAVQGRVTAAMTRAAATAWARGGHPALPEVTVPLVTLQGRAARAGESRLLGPLDPAMARDLAAAAARSPFPLGVTIVDEQGYATGHGIARPRRGRGSSRGHRA